MQAKIWKSKTCQLLGIVLVVASIFLLTQRGEEVSSMSRDVTQQLAQLKEESPDVIQLLPEQFLSTYRSFCWYDDGGKFWCLPKVYLAGMPKCGSTDLYSKLIWHPDLAKPPCGKENHFWTRSRLGKSTNHLKGGEVKKQSFDSFLKQIGPANMEGQTGSLLIDGTQSLLWDLLGWEARYPQSSKPPYSNAELIHLVAPMSKIIVIIRDPVERLYSDYLYFNGDDYGLHENRSALSFDDAVRAELGRFVGCLTKHNLRRCCYSSQNDPKMRLHLGVYITYVRDWYQLFGENMMVVSLEDYSKQPLPVLYRIYNFLQVPEPSRDDLSIYIKSTSKKNARSKSDSTKGGMLASTRKLLQDFYQPYNLELAEYLRDTRFLYNYK